MLDALGEEKAALIGHDWGSMVVWNAALLYPERFTGVMGMSVPYGGVGAEAPTAGWQKAMGDQFFYILYHNEEDGVAEMSTTTIPDRFCRCCMHRRIRRGTRQRSLTLRV